MSSWQREAKEGRDQRGRTLGDRRTHAGVHPRKRNPTPSFWMARLSFVSMLAPPPPLELALITRALTTLWQRHESCEQAHTEQQSRLEETRTHSAGEHTVVATVPAMKLALKWSQVPSLKKPVLRRPSFARS